MKVVHVSCVAPPEGGGIGVVANQEVLHLRKLGVDAILVAPETFSSVIPAQDFGELSRTAGIHPGMDPRIRKDDRDGYKDDEEGVVTYLPSLRIGNVGRLMGLKKIVKDADVVHLHYPFYFTAGLIARWRRQNKIKHLVITLHMDATDKGWRCLAARLHRRFLQKRVLNAADLLLVSTLDYVRNSSFAPFVGDHRLRELPFGVDTDKFRPGEIPPTPLDKGGIQNPPFAREGRVRSTVGTVSVMDRAHPFKGIDVLLRAMTKMPSNVSCVLVGDGDRRQTYETLAKELGIAERVHFAGRLSEEDLIKTLQSLDVFIFPSTSRAEAFGLAPLEAMSCGVPVIASDLPGVREVIKGAGVTVPANDDAALAKAVSELLNDDDRRKLLSKAARDKAVDLDWNNHAQKLLGYYKQICESQS